MTPAIQLRGNERLIPEEHDPRAYAALMGRLDSLQTEVDSFEASEPTA